MSIKKLFTTTTITIYNYNTIYTTLIPILNYVFLEK